LQFAHERTDEEGTPLRIVHCDISPQNILVSYSGEVKITDFGISRAAFQANGTNDVIRGKYAYMSPEQVEGRELDGRSDVFSLGILLFELLTGRRLFKAKTRDETLARVRRAEVPSLRAYRPEVSEDLEGLVLKSLLADRNLRYASAGAFLEDLSVLMVREGHRATNNDLAAYLKDVIENAARPQPVENRVERPGAPTPLVVLAAEACPPPRSIAAPRVSPASLVDEWSSMVSARGGELWERSDGGLLAVWTAPPHRERSLKECLESAVSVATDLRQAAQRAGYRLSAGVAPGVARFGAESARPEAGWELAGPFYLARWMMNLSAHRGRVLLTEVGAKQVAEAKTSLLGRICIQGNRYIHLFEMA
jgi:hypothetical protein